MNSKIEILEIIQRNGGKIDRQGLHKATGIEYETIDDIVDELVEEGYLEYLIGAQGRIKNMEGWKMVKITRKGKQKLGI